MAMILPMLVVQCSLVLLTDDQLIMHVGTAVVRQHAWWMFAQPHPGIVAGMCGCADSNPCTLLLFTYP